MTPDEVLLDMAGVIVADAYACASNLWCFHLSSAGRYQAHARELLRIIGGLRRVTPDEAQEMRIVWECFVLARVEWFRENEG
jgi:hypothetical protein